VCEVSHGNDVRHQKVRTKTLRKPYKNRKKRRNVAGETSHPTPPLTISSPHPPWVETIESAKSRALGEGRRFAAATFRRRRFAGDDSPKRRFAGDVSPFFLGTFLFDVCVIWITFLEAVPRASYDICGVLVQ